MLYCPNFFWNVLQVWMTGKDVYLQMTWSWLCVHIVCNEIQVKVNLEITTFFFYLRFPYCPNFFWFGVVDFISTSLNSKPYYNSLSCLSKSEIECESWKLHSPCKAVFMQYFRSHVIWHLWTPACVKTDLCVGHVWHPSISLSCAFIMLSGCFCHIQCFDKWPSEV